MKNSKSWTKKFIKENGRKPSPKEFEIALHKGEFKLISSGFWPNHKKSIISLSVTLIVILGAVSTFSIHNYQLQQQKLARKAEEKRAVNKANSAIDNAYKTRKQSDIQSAQTAVNKLNKVDAQALKERLSDLAKGLKDISSADTAVKKAEDLGQAATSAIPVKPKMNLDQIETGNYSSIVGTWTAKDNAQTLTITESEIISANQNISKALKSPRINNGLLTIMLGQSGGTGATMQFLVFLPAGIKGQGVQDPGSDSTKNRIVYHVGGANEAVLYKSDNENTNSQDNLSKVVKAVNTAQAAIGKLSQDWESEDKKALQQRLDKVDAVIKKLASESAN